MHAGAPAHTTEGEKSRQHLETLVLELKLRIPELVSWFPQTYMMALHGAWLLLVIPLYQAKGRRECEARLAAPAGECPSMRHDQWKCKSGEKWNGSPVAERAKERDRQAKRRGREDSENKRQRRRRRDVSAAGDVPLFADVSGGSSIRSFDEYHQAYCRRMDEDSA